MARKSSLEFDPNRSPFSTPAPRMGYLDHPEVAPGKLMVNNDTLQVVPIPSEKPYPMRPLRLPDKLMAVDQPHVHTCGYPKRDGDRLLNAGCWASEGGGCPILNQFGRIGPVNLIVEKNGKVDSCRCYHFYTGITPSGRPSSQVHMQLDGWNMLTDRTTIPQNIMNPDTKREQVVETEVPELPPFYRKAEPKKKRGRPRKHANRESMASAGAEIGTQS